MERERADGGSLVCIYLHTCVYVCFHRLAQGAEAIELERKKGPSDDVSYIEFEPVTGTFVCVWTSGFIYLCI